MGVDDLMAAKNMVMAALKTTEMKRIDYQTFNSLQKVENTAVEARYNSLLQRVGTCVSFDADLVTHVTTGQSSGREGRVGFKKGGGLLKTSFLCKSQGVPQKISK
jgi:hypothetical protein